jgi:Tol biopolymer transport system component
MKLIALLTALAAAPLAAQTTELANRNTAGEAGNWQSDPYALSPDGRYVVFASQATNLLPNPLSNGEDIYLRDRATGQTTCLIVDWAGSQLQGQHSDPALSADLRFVAFWSNAWNLVGGSGTVFSDIYLLDRSTSSFQRISDPPTQEANNTSAQPSISGDGQRIVFTSLASNLVAGDTNGVGEGFLFDQQTNALTRVTLTSTGAQINGQSNATKISFDGRFVVFTSNGTNVVPGDTNGVFDVFVRELATGAVERVSVSSAGVQSDGTSYDPVCSSDARFVAFDSSATNLVAGDTNGDRDVFVRDRQTGATTRVSVDSSGAQVQGNSTNAAISGDGRFVAFLSASAGLVLGDTNQRSDDFLRDRATGITTRVSVDSLGNEGNATCFPPHISLDGTVVAFGSSSSNLVADDTNGKRDAFVRDRFLRPTIYCTAGTTTHGCQPSIASSGNPSASAATGFTISVSSVEGLKSGIIFYGISGRVALPWASGSTSYLCVKPPTQRAPAQSSGGVLNTCNGSLSLDLLAFAAANPGALGQPLALGQRIDAQAWFRDPPAPKTTNLSDALEFDLVP